MFAWHVTGGFCLNFPTSAAKEQPHSLHTKQTTSVLEAYNKMRHMGTWLQHPKDSGNSVQKGVSLYSSRAVSSQVEAAPESRERRQDAPQQTCFVLYLFGWYEAWCDLDVHSRVWCLCMCLFVCLPACLSACLWLAGWMAGCPCLPVRLYFCMSLCMYMCM